VRREERADQKGEGGRMRREERGTKGDGFQKIVYF
jgi:hypothetical protein